MGFTMFFAKVQVIGSGAYVIELLSDLLESHHCEELLTTALFRSDGVTLLFYFALHWASRRQA